MPDKAHVETDKKLFHLENDLTKLYEKANRKIQREIESLLKEIYLDNEDATPIQRLKYAEKNGKDKLIKKYVDIVVSANEQAAKKINQSHSEIYKTNFISAGDMLIKQLQHED